MHEVPKVLKLVRDHVRPNDVGETSSPLSPRPLETDGYTEITKVNHLILIFISVFNHSELIFCLKCFEQA